MQQSSASIIPVETVTEFIFSAGSTITIPVTQQGNLDALIIAEEFAQSITVDQALCRGLEGKDRLKVQRAITRSIIDIIQSIDGFKYSERRIWNKEGGDGTRFKYVCADSLQNRDRKANIKKEKEGDGNAPGETSKRKGTQQQLPTYDCGGALYIKFSMKRQAVNVVYKHNPIHRDVDSRPTNGPPLPDPGEATVEPSNGTTPKKRKLSEKFEPEADRFDRNDLDTPTLAEVTRAPAREKRKKIDDSNQT